VRYIVDDSAFTVQPVDHEGVTPLSWFDEGGFEALSRWWLQASWQRRYSYQFHWLGRPIIQLPQDVLMMQQLIWRARPSVIIETGIAHGGSVVLHASLLKLIEACQPDGRDAASGANRPHVVAVDIDIRPENRRALESHPLRGMYTLIQGSSIDPATVRQVRECLRPDDRVMVVLDSNHRRAHVLAELQAYAPLASMGCTVVVMDGIMPLLSNLPSGGRDWEHDNPAAAIVDFLATAQGRDFGMDHTFDGFALTHSPGGVLVRRDEVQP